MSTPLSIRPGALVASEPVALATVVRAVFYVFFAKRVDPETMAILMAACEALLAYLTRRTVTPAGRVPRVAPSAEPTDQLPDEAGPFGLTRWPAPEVATT